LKIVRTDLKLQTPHVDRILALPVMIVRVQNCSTIYKHPHPRYHIRIRAPLGS
jgi:hypothetical protein